MPRPRVYVETTIPSAYYPLRNSPGAIELRDITRTWWSRAKAECEMLTSAVVEDELEKGPGADTTLRLALTKGLEVLGRSPEITETARELVRQKVMPGGKSDDAYHLALAMHYHCDVLVSWDRAHLANPNKTLHIRRISERLGLLAPAILTPREHLRRIDGRAL
ncbi:MAG TPA: PIN domain-containing protein [Longimicrobium sp.]|nr:PIN domain-containing protein [Longimicrobium sp.]